jgi:hypothetical protein
MTVSILVSILLIVLEQTDWAAEINQQGYSHGKNEGGQEGEQRNFPSYLMYILPFVKELILIGVPMALVIYIAKLFGWLKQRFANKNS